MIVFVGCSIETFTVVLSSGTLRGRRGRVVEETWIEGAVSVRDLPEGGILWAY